MRRLAVAVALAVAGIGPLVAAPAPACASEAGAHAALVVDTGRAVRTYCVALGGGSVTGLDVIRLAGRQHGLPYELGFGGQAVCSLAGVGVSGSDCWAAYPDFWGYWQGDGSGGWTWSSAGAGSVRVGDGDVQGWSWGSGDSASTHHAPPRIGLGDVCAPDEPTDEAAGEDGSAGGAGGSPPSPRPSPSSARERERGEGAGERRSPAPRPTPAGEPSAGSDRSTVRAAGAAVPAGPGGPPPASYLALALAAALVVGGWLRLRARGSA